MNLREQCRSCEGLGSAASHLAKTINLGNNLSVFGSLYTSKAGSNLNVVVRCKLKGIDLDRGQMEEFRGDHGCIIWILIVVKSESLIFKVIVSYKLRPLLSVVEGLSYFFFLLLKRQQPLG